MEQKPMYKQLNSLLKNTHSHDDQMAQYLKKKCIYLW